MSEFIRIAETSERLKEAIKASGKKQIDVAKETGIDKGSISNYISGRYEPKLPAIKKLALVLDVDEMWLWGYDVPMQRQKKKPAADDGNELPKRKKDFIERVKKMSDSELDRLDQILRLVEGKKEED